MISPLSLKVSRNGFPASKAAWRHCWVWLVSCFAFAYLMIGADQKRKAFTPEDYNWWAIQPLTDPALPEAYQSSWVRNPIDLFVLEKLKDAGLDPAPEADVYELVRRVYFDLHGLPPTLEQLKTFVSAADVNRETAYESLIDELLASPRYGERWAQHWMDVVRYSETDGYKADGYRPTVYLYRDYVIKSFNEDKPYDRFICEQLAGDELDPGNPEVEIGTAFLRHGIWEYNQRNAAMHWELIINEMTNVTADAFLGLGFGCAQCHDHKFDPILQKDYYALQSFLATTHWPDEKPLATPDEVKRYEAELAEWNKKTNSIRTELEILQKPFIDAKRDFAIESFPPEIQAMYHKPKVERSTYEQQMAELVDKWVIEQTSRILFAKELKAQPANLTRFEALNAQMKTFELEKPEPLTKAFITTDISTIPVDALLGGRAGKEPVPPGFLTLLGDPEPEIQPTSFSTGRRTALARWIARPDNPLTARVMANRLWHYHFGSGIVPTPNDFGTLGEDPSHPELLDWLTSRFIENGWHLKPLHKLIMMSSTYRQTARREPGLQASTVDTSNRLLWRFPPTRLSAEQVRDAMLLVSGELKQRLGGPSEEGDASVRSVYVKKRRNKPEKFLHSFDAPQGFDSEPARLQTTSPIQSLFLVNSEWPLQRAASFARRILGESRQVDDSLIETAISLAYNRPPSDGEMSLAREFISTQENLLDRQNTYASPNIDYKNPALFSVNEGFSVVNKSLSLGDMALHLEPGSPYERLELPPVELTGDSFTVEAVVILNSLHVDASVNTLVSQWNGDSDSSGWSIGVTSSQSKYDPRNFIVQLVGENGAGNLEYEVVASGLRVPLGKPVYLAAVVTANKQPDESGGGNVVFYLKDLSDPYSRLESVTIEHSIADHIYSPETKKVLGGRHAEGHLWHGQIARLSMTNHPLSAEELFLVSPTIARQRMDWRFSGASPQTAIPRGASWMLPGKLETTQDPLFGAVTDFCHALITSNAFFYLH